jgi:DNA processing protein
MLASLAATYDGPARAPISQFREMGAYEALWLEQGATFKTIADRFAADPDALPSDFVPPARADECAREVVRRFKEAGVEQFGIRIHHAGDYPARLRDAKYPIELLYFRGVWELTETRSVAIVGTRQPSPEGAQRARQLAREFVRRGFTVVSGLAAGIDTEAHTSALKEGGRTIAVIGTPLSTVYPAANRSLQEEIAKRFLVISQIPVLRYGRQGPHQNRIFFPERNVTMSAMTEATIIVEAGETSGTLTQARAALHQGRKLFILDSCFERKDLTWPARFAEQGAIRVRGLEDVWAALEQ